MASPVSTLALITLDGAFKGKAWQGPTLSGSLRGVKPDLALWRPSKNRRCIWEQLLHATYWKLTILRVFDPATSLSLLRPGSNWPTPPITRLTKDAGRLWKADLARLHEVHEALHSAAAALAENDWLAKPRRPSTTAARSLTYADYLAGAAAHDAYHTGQIRLLKRLHAQA